MSDWNYLPTDVLSNVFQHLEEIIKVSDFPNECITIPTKDMLQYQLTCKNWTRLAQINIYKRVLLRSYEQLDMFIDTLLNSNTGPLVKDIVLDFQYIKSKPLLEFIQQIAYFCPELKSLDMRLELTKGIWKIIRSERLKGHFLKLEAIPFGKMELPHIIEYTTAASTLHQTLHKLVISDLHPTLIENKHRLSHFTELDTLFFRFNYHDNIYTVDQQIEKCRKIKAISITFDKYNLEEDTEFRDAKVNSAVHVSPLVKHLRLTNFLYDSRIYSYIMQAFPNLDDIDLRFISIRDTHTTSIIKLSTHEAVQLLYYLIKMTKIDIPYIPLQNLNDTMLEFYDRYNVITNISITYNQVSDMSYTPHMAIWNRSKKKNKIKVLVHYVQRNLISLPRIGLIEKSGRNLQFIKIDMRKHFQELYETTNSISNDCNFFDILQQCPNLRGIHIVDTILYTPIINNCLSKKRSAFSEYIYFNRLLISWSFLPKLSPQVSYIAELTLKDCLFTEKTDYETNIIIDMPVTRFNTIIYDDYLPSSKIYLKLITLADNCTAWFVRNGDHYGECTEDEYEASLQLKQVFSVFIRCENVNVVDIRSTRVRMLVKSLNRPQT